MNASILSPEWIDLFFKDVPLGLTTVDFEGNIEIINPLARSHYHCQSAEEGKIIHYTELFSDFIELQVAIKSCINGEQLGFSFGVIKFMEKFLSLKANVSEIGIIIVSVDITLSRSRELDMLNALLEGQEMERQRLAKDIHDGVGPLISTLKLHIEAMKLELNTEEMAVKERLANIDELINQVAIDIRSVSHALIPSTLADLGLETTLENLCRKADDASLAKIVFYSTSLTVALDRHTELSLYRIAQELLNNALKYSKAKTISLQLIQHAESIGLVIEDDGIGFDKKELRHLLNHGIGLSNVIMRTRSLNGIYTIESQPNKGVFVSVEIPFK